MKHVISAQQFDRQTIEELFKLATNLEQTPDNYCMKGKIMASLFYEPSTRTRFSFESAMLRLGGGVITTENATQFSSVSKGETLEDTIRTMNQYVDVIVIRHNEVGSAQKASAVSDIPIINAGDGAGQHPTQALLDLYTISREHNKIDGIHIAMIGDLKHGRTVHSLSYMLGMYDYISISFIAPKALQMKEEILQYLKEKNISYRMYSRIEDVISDVDVIYQTRIQKERFISIEEYQKYKGIYQITKQTVDAMKEDAIIMHPLPRVDEILYEVDNSAKAVYFKQVYYGLLIRQALLKTLLS